MKRRVKKKRLAAERRRTRRVVVRMLDSHDITEKMHRDTRAILRLTDAMVGRYRRGPEWFA